MLKGIERKQALTVQVEKKKGESVPGQRKVKLEIPHINKKDKTLSQQGGRIERELIGRDERKTRERDFVLPCFYRV